MSLSNKVNLLLSEINKTANITEIVINDCDKIFVEKNSVFTQLNAKLSKKDIDDFISATAKLNKKECSEKEPIFNGKLIDGSRVNIIMPPFSSPCAAITIRKFSHLKDDLDSGLEKFYLDPSWIDFFKAVVSARLNLVISGGTSSGKTSFLNMLLSAVHPAERLVVIEDTLELQIAHQNCVRLELLKSPNPVVNIELSDLVKNSLRMRPDRIIIGEVRSKEVVDLIDSMNTGHDGSITTIHANNSVESLARLEGLYAMGGRDIPVKSVRSQIKNAIDLVIQLKRVDKGMRVVSEIREVTGMEGDMISTQLLGEFKDGKLEKTKNPCECIEKLVRYGGLPKDFFN
ncbi:ATPase, T2SS/T4P/T4SS family [bacterium]|nr:ATPase, T2SS/T4P/T4SS family [bacterium]